MNVVSIAFYRDFNSCYESERAGAGRGVFFVNYLRAVVRGHWAVFPDWQLWIHHDELAREFPYFKVLERMQERKLLKLIPMGTSKALCLSMLWRMLPCWNLDVDRVLCRDLDAFPTPRERRAVDKWIASDRAISAMHDSESHGSAALMGGLVGFKCDWIRNLWSGWEWFVDQARIFEIDLSQHGSDQRLLNASILPHAGDQLAWEDKASLGPKDEALDTLTNHLGGAFHVDPAVAWLKAHPEYCPKLAEIEACEDGWVQPR